MRRALSAFAIACSLVWSASPAHAWSEETHQTTGAIAWADLAQRNPSALAELSSLARSHQDYPLFARYAARLPAELHDRALFEWLARWPDDIRHGPEDQPKWHYELQVVSGRDWLWPFYNGLASEGFAYNRSLLADSCAAPAERAKAIGWLIHIVGDIQQPLHAGHQMTGAFQLTDRAGVLAFVRREPGGEPTDLHSYWDQMIQRGGMSLPAGQNDWVTALMEIWPRAALPELDRAGDPGVIFTSYLVESATLARLVAYQGTYLGASADPAAAPVISARENAVARTLVARRVATSGYRIADTLASALGEAAHRQASCGT